MQIRILNADEQDRLNGHPGLGGADIPPLTTVVIAEDEGEIVGFSCLVPVLHLEPFWIDPKYRKTSLMAKLWGATVGLFDRYQANAALSTTVDPVVGDYMERLGYTALPHKLYMFKKDTI